MTRAWEWEVVPGSTLDRRWHMAIDKNLIEGVLV